MLTTVPQDQYNLEREYLKAKPVMDWVGVRYIALEKVFFRAGARQDDQALLALDPHSRQVYEDPWMRVVESTTAQPKAIFSSSIDIFPDQQTILRELKLHPEIIDGPLMVEAGAAPRMTFARSAGDSSKVPVRVLGYTPNSVRLELDASSGGIVVLKDAYYPGWRGQVNGVPSDVIRVDGLVRGIVVPAAGHYEVQFNYQPDSFTQGVWLSALSALLLVIVLGASGLASRRVVRRAV
jgi:hypothetical protein